MCVRYRNICFTLNNYTSQEVSVLQASACNTDTTQTQPHQISNSL